MIKTSREKKGKSKVLDPSDVFEYYKDGYFVTLWAGGSDEKNPIYMSWHEKKDDAESYFNALLFADVEIPDFSDSLNPPRKELEEIRMDSPTGKRRIEWVTVESWEPEDLQLDVDEARERLRETNGVLENAQDVFNEKFFEPCYDEDCLAEDQEKLWAMEDEHETALDDYNRLKARLEKYNAEKEQDECES